MSASDSKEFVRFPLVEAGAAPAEGLIAIVRRLSIARSLEEIMEAVTHAARALLQADGATFVLRDGDRCYYAEEDAISPLWKGRRFPMSACISGWCMTHGQTVALPDIYEDPRIPADAYRPTFVRSLAMVPVRLEEPIAALGAYWSEMRVITPAEVELLQTIANSAALAVAYVQLQQARSAGQVGEGPARVRPSGAPEPASSTRGERAPSRTRPAIGVLFERLRREGLRPNSPEVYAFAVVCAALATLVRLGVGALGVRGLAPFSTYYPAVLIAALVGGGRAGVLAAALGGVMAFWAFLPPQYSLAALDMSHALNMSLYVFSAGLIIWATERYRRALLRLTDEDARRVTLARELQHRARNTLSVVQAIVSQSLRGDPAQAQIINQRIRAGVDSSDILNGPANEHVGLREVLAAELEPFDVGRMTLEGEDVRLDSGARSTLALAVHELATNAVKYGALSAPEGRLAVSWKVIHGRATVRWVEANGPPVAPPQKRGYGSVFLRRLLEASRGSITIEFNPSGVVAEISLPLGRGGGAESRQLGSPLARRDRPGLVRHGPGARSGPATRWRIRRDRYGNRGQRRSIACGRGSRAGRARRVFARNDASWGLVLTTS